MGNRLSKIYTGTGDKGTTGLGDGSRIAKSDLRIELIGTVDEVNSQLGLLIAKLPPQHSMSPLLLNIQQVLFNLGGELAVPGMHLIEAADVNWLESQIDDLNQDLPMLKEFVLPGGNEVAALAHIARATVRRAERISVALNEQSELSEHLLKWLNRASDLLFVAARVLARENGGQEVLWNNPTR